MFNNNYCGSIFKYTQIESTYNWAGLEQDEIGVGLQAAAHHLQHIRVVKVPVRLGFVQEELLLGGGSVFSEYPDHHLVARVWQNSRFSLYHLFDKHNRYH